MTTPVCHTLKLQCETNSKYVLIMRSTVFVTFVVKEYLGGVISLFSKVVDHQQVCYLSFFSNLYDEHKLNAEMLCIKYNNTIMNSLEQLYWCRHWYQCVL